MKKAGGILFLLFGAGLLYFSAQKPGSTVLPGEPNPEDDPDYVPEPPDPGTPQPIDEPVTITLGDGSSITLLPYNYTVPVPGVDYMPLPTEWDITLLPDYQNMIAAMNAEAIEVQSGMAGIDTTNYGSVYFRTGWNLLANYYQGEVLPSIWQVAIFISGHTPLSLYRLKQDAISALQWHLHGEVREDIRPPSLEDFYWPNPPTDPNYRRVRNFLTGRDYVSDNLLVSELIGETELDFMFRTQMTIPMYLMIRNRWNQSSGVNYNFPR